MTIAATRRPSRSREETTLHDQQDIAIARSAPPPDRSRPAGTCAALAIWMLVIGATVQEIIGRSEIFSFGFYTFHLIDPAPVAAILAVAAYLAEGRPRWSIFAAPVLVMAMLIGINLLRGVAIAPDAALLWARANLGIAAFLMLAIAMRPDVTIMRAARRALIFGSLVLGALVMLRLLVSPTLFMAPDAVGAETLQDGRPLSAQGAFLLVLASLMLASELLQRRSTLLDPVTIWAGLLPFLTLLTRQGTTSIALLASLLAVVMLQQGPHRQSRALLAAVGAIVALGLLAAALPSLVETQDFTQRTGNLGTRREIWQSLMTLWHELPLMVQLFGLPAGERPALIIFANGGFQPWPYSIHSMYFGALPLMGYAGALAYIVLLGVAGGKALTATLSRHRPIPAFALACLLATTIFSVSYEVRHSEILGLFLPIWWLRANTARFSSAPRLQAYGAQTSR